MLLILFPPHLDFLLVLSLLLLFFSAVLLLLLLLLLLDVEGLGLSTAFFLGFLLIDVVFAFFINHFFFIVRFIVLALLVPL